MASQNEDLFIGAASVGLIALTIHEGFAHGAEILRVIGHGGRDIVTFVASAVGSEAAGIAVLVVTAVPIALVSFQIVVKVSDAAEKRPKALIVAIGSFFGPLFLDFFKDEIPADDKIQKLLLGASGLVAFLAATAIWDKARARKPLAKIAGRVVASILYLLPLLCALGYVVIKVHGRLTETVRDLAVADWVGLIGLLVIGTAGIILSQYYEAP